MFSIVFHQERVFDAFCRLLFERQVDASELYRRHCISLYPFKHLSDCYNEEEDTYQPATASPSVIIIIIIIIIVIRVNNNSSDTLEE
jgi:hypothetical protein